jgi:hypothetical protein
MKKKTDTPNDHILTIMSDPSKVTQIIQSGIWQALLRHKQLGNPVCEWRNNQVVWVQPEDIPTGPYS